MIKKNRFFRKLKMVSEIMKIIWSLVLFYVFISLLLRNEIKLKRDTKNMIDFIKIIPSRTVIGGNGNGNNNQQIINGNSAPNTPIIEQDSNMNMFQQYKICVPDLRTFVLNVKW